MTPPHPTRYARALAIYRETSRDAWMSFEPYVAATDARILHVIRDGGATAEEVEAATGLRHQTVSAQIRHMVEGGLLVGSDERRPTRSGRGATVWQLAAHDPVPEVAQP